MTVFGRVVVTALLFLSTTPAWAQTDADAVAADPMQLPKKILAVRGEETNRSQLRIVWDRTRDDQPIAAMTAWIGADYFAIVDGDHMTITDLRLRRRFVLDRQAGTLVNLSLYGDVMFRRVELVRRMEIAAALNKESDHPALPESLDPFWIESELSIAGMAKLPNEIVPRTESDTTEFLYSGQKVATVLPGDTAVPTDLANSYSTFLRDTLPVHPTIVQWLAQNGRVPKRLDFTSEARGKTEQMSLRLESASSGAADFPLPPHLSVVLVPWGADDPDVGLLRQVLPQMVAAASATDVDRATRIAADRIAIGDEFEHGQTFAAALRLTELALRWGRAASECGSDPAAGRCFSKNEIDQRLRKDPRATAMFTATALQEHDPAKALTIWEGIDRSDVPNGYVVDVFLARLLSAKGDREAAARAFVAAFAGDASIPALYRELGDHFARVSRLDLAWLCYDLGRALPNRDPPDALTGIDDIEQHLAAAYPDLF